MLWAAKYGVTGGIGGGMFGPNNTCTRAQVVTFLYKTSQIDRSTYEEAPNLRAYIPAVEATIADKVTFDGSSFLCDLDDDGTEELVLYWLCNNLVVDGNIQWGHVYSIYDIENGMLVTKVDKELVCYDAGAPSGDVFAANYNGRKVLGISDSNSTYVDGTFASYEYYELYDGKTLEKITSATVYRKFESSTVLKCYVDGNSCNYSEFLKVYNAIAPIVTAEIYTNDGADGSMGLSEMLSYLKNSA